MDEKRLLTVDEAADRLSISRSALYPRVRGGQIRSVKIGKSRRIPVEALDEFVAGLTEAQT